MSIKLFEKKNIVNGKQVLMAGFRDYSLDKYIQKNLATIIQLLYIFKKNLEKDLNVPTKYILQVLFYKMMNMEIFRIILWQFGWKMYLFAINEK